jgi:hypothetical protein
VEILIFMPLEHDKNMKGLSGKFPRGYQQSIYGAQWSPPPSNHYKLMLHLSFPSL